MRKTKPLSDRFWAKVNTSGDCWLWTGSLLKGYGQLNAGRRGEGMLRAHRVSWELHHGPIPSGLCVLHDCDTPACVRPSHLFLGTHGDNCADKIAKQRDRVGTRYKHARLTPRQVRTIRCAPGLQQLIAAQFGISQSYVSGIKNRRTWRHLE